MLLLTSSRLPSCPYSLQRSSKLLSQCNIPEAMRHHGECCFLKWLTLPCVFYNFLNFILKEMFLMFITTPSFAYQSLTPADFIHNSLANIYALSTSQPPIRQLEQKSLGLGKVWLLVWTPDHPLGNVQYTGNNCNKRTRLKVRPAGIGTQSFSWLAVWLKPVA